MSIGLEIDLEEIDKKVILRLDGRVDVSTSSLLEKKISQLVEEKHCHLLLDFSRVDYLSSAGMRVLLFFSKKLAGKESSFFLFSLSEEVREVLKMAGFDKILKIFPSEKEALQFRK